MNEPTRDQLLGYVLGALDGSDQEQVEATLDHDPQLRVELDRLTARLRQVGLAEPPRHFEPPLRLAERTCRFVAAQTEPLVTRARALSSYDGAEQQRRMTWYDMLTAAAVLIIGVSLFLPAVSHSRFQSQIVSCQNHLRTIGQAMHGFSDAQPDGRFPAPESTGNRAVAGIVAPLLVANQFAESPIFQCPGAPRSGAGDFRVPPLAAVDAASGRELAAMQRAMGGDYGYNLGYIADGQLQAPRDARRAQYALVADAPSDMQKNRVSGNHRGGLGQNMLYEDGHVRFMREIVSSQLLDDPYHNRAGWVAAGVDREDAVLGASADHPLPVMVASPADR